MPVSLMVLSALLLHRSIFPDKMWYPDNHFSDLSTKTYVVKYSLELPHRGASSEYPLHMYGEVR